MPYPPAWTQAEKLRKICTAAGPNVNNMKSSSVFLAAVQGTQYCTCVNVVHMVSACETKTNAKEATEATEVEATIIE